MTEVQRLAKIMVLKDLLKEYELLAKYNGGTDYDRYCALEMAIEASERVPKTGHWKKENPPMVERYPFCSECGFVNPFETALNYCPNCGCRMGSEVQNADSN